MVGMTRLPLHMKHLAIPTSALLAFTVAATAFAQSNESSGRLDFGDIDLDRYDDAPFADFETDLAVSVLTEEGVLLGNEDGTFRDERNLNRAEFVQIVMRLVDDTGTVNKNCFPDVSPDAWYADPVCRAKALGIVRGNARVGVSENLWRFEPTRDVQYEEAVKMLVQVYALPIVGDTEGGDWYVPYIEAAEELNLDLSGLSPGDHITRGEMARLTLAFLAESEGQLTEYRDAERDEGSSRSSSSRSSSSSSRSSMSSSRSSSNSSFARDPDTNVSVRSNILVLGTTSPVLGAVNIFPANEDLDVQRITVDFMGDALNVASVRVYESSTGRFLGTASRQSSGIFIATLSDGSLILPRRVDSSIYVRAMLRDVNSGGTGGEDIQIDDITIDGTGGSSSDDYSVTSSATFQVFETAAAAITRVTSTGALQTTAFTTGQNQILGSFDFDAVSPDSRYTPRVTALEFSVSAAAGVTLSNIELVLPGTDTTSSCSQAGTVITCSSIPASIGTVDDSQTIRLVADVADSGQSNNPFLQVTLNDAGTPSSAGAVTWTDGTTTYTWLAVDTPVARGIRYQ